MPVNRRSAIVSEPDERLLHASTHTNGAAGNLDRQYGNENIHDDGVERSNA